MTAVVLIVMNVGPAEPNLPAVTDTRTQVSTAYSRPGGIDGSSQTVTHVSYTQPIETHLTNDVSAPSVLLR